MSGAKSSSGTIGLGKNEKPDKLFVAPSHLMSWGFLFAPVMTCSSGRESALDEERADSRRLLRPKADYE